MLDDAIIYNVSEFISGKRTAVIWTVITRAGACRRVSRLCHRHSGQPSLTLRGGTGNLLSAAKLKWPEQNSTRMISTALRYMNCPAACLLTEVECLDFLSPEFHALQANGLRKWSLILLNPPFSQRDVAVHVPVGQHSELRCSRSMAFVMSAVQHLAQGGQLLAILSCRYPYKTKSTRQPSASTQRDLDEVVRAPAYGLFNEVDVTPTSFV